MKPHARKALFTFSTLAAFCMTTGCDQPLYDELGDGDRIADSDVSDEIEDIDEVNTADELSLVDADGIEVDEDGRPLSPEILTLHSSLEEQLLEEEVGELIGLDLDDLGHAIGIGPEDAPVHADDLVADDNLMAAFGLRWSGTHSYGGDLFSASYDIIRGPSSCASGKTRAFAHAYAEGSGSCYVLGWYTFDPTDCRIRVRVNRPGWFAGGKCKMFVYDQ